VKLWEPARLPQGFCELWCEELSSLSELAKLRARLRTSLTGSSTVVRPEREHWSERLVLITDELTSNALRHGRAPVAAALSRGDDRWLVSVRDSSADVPPAPAQGRDPALGGFGLYLVADLSAAHGWFLERGQKSVWAVVEADEVA
jgi:anti-sigma regulatory factor (Ser/Thr protein kinase)